MKELLAVFLRRTWPFRLLMLSVVIAAALSLSNASDGLGKKAAPPKPRERFSFADVQRLAQRRAAQSYVKPAEELPESLAKLSYDQYRDIRFRADHALWHGQGLFEVQFFHRGFNFGRKVAISEVTDTGVQPVPYDSSQFDFGALNQPVKLPPETGFAGFRVHFPLQTPRYRDELIVFLGASYFRVLGRNQVYGISARGLAVDTAVPKGEEFPQFTDFWLVKPQPEQRTLTIYAILDSKSVAGAYRFEVRPGGLTQVEVASELYPRRTIDKLGIAPMTSMFLFGENRGERQFDDFRPEVHDSDGLLSQTGGGEWIWRPVANPHELRVSAFMDEHPRGFGLSQRDRNVSHYEDNESRFQQRPSYWIEPIGDWGKGHVELVEIPTDEEIHDNIVSYWVPDAPVRARRPLRYSYLLSAYSYSPRWPPGGKVIATRMGSANIGSAGNRAPEGMRRVLVDFAGGDLEGLHESQPVKAEVAASNGEVSDVTVERQPDGLWRVAFRLKPNGHKPADLRCYLTLYGEVLTETWTYLWTP
jgi:glucans biosynthesis protein